MEGQEQWIVSIINVVNVEIDTETLSKNETNKMMLNDE